ncbi:hypothetical protein D3C86_1849140 [compost metagenome]
MNAFTDATASGFLEPTDTIAIATKIAKIRTGTTLPLAMSLIGLDGTKSRITWEKVGISFALKSFGTACAIPLPGSIANATRRPIKAAIPVVSKNQPIVLTPNLRSCVMLDNEEILLITKMKTSGITSILIKLT